MTDTELDEYLQRVTQQNTAHLSLLRGYIDIQMMLAYLQGEITFRELGEEAVRVKRMKDFLRNVQPSAPLIRLVR